MMMDSSYEDSPPSSASNGPRVGLVQKRISKFTSNNNSSNNSNNNSTLNSNPSPMGHVRNMIRATEESNSRMRKNHIMAPKPFSRSNMNSRAKTEVITKFNHQQHQQKQTTSKSFGAADHRNILRRTEVFNNNQSISSPPRSPKNTSTPNRFLSKPLRAAAPLPLPDAPLSSASKSTNNNHNNNNSLSNGGLALARLVNVVSQQDEENYENLKQPSYENMPTSGEYSVDSDDSESRLGDRTPDIPPRSSEAVKPVIPPKPKKLSSSSLSPRNNNSSFDDNLELEGNVDPQIYNSREMLRRIQSKSVSFCSINDSNYDRSDLLQRRRSCSEFQDLIQKKSEIRERILSKINILRDERDCILEEKQDNDLVGREIISRLEHSNAPSTDIDRVHNYLQEVEQITKLTVSLNIRLNRVDKMLDSKKIMNRTSERENLQGKKSKLLDQIKEARGLQVNTERRGKNIRQILSRNLDQDSVETFDQFLSNLVGKITELKEMDQRVQLGEEQLVALDDSSNSSFNNSWQLASPAIAAAASSSVVGASLNSSLGSLSEH